MKCAKKDKMLKCYGTTVAGQCVSACATAVLVAWLFVGLIERVAAGGQVGDITLHLYCSLRFWENANEG